MPARIRKTVPFFGTLPHREHRSKGGRVENYIFKRSSNQAYALKIKKRNREIDRQLKKKLREQGGRRRLGWANLAKNGRFQRLWTSKG